MQSKTMNYLVPNTCRIHPHRMGSRSTEAVFIKIANGPERFKKIQGYFVAVILGILLVQWNNTRVFLI